MIKKLKKLKQVLQGKDFFNNYQIIEVDKKRLGSDYGGWWVATNNLDDKSIVFSLGLGEDVSFDIGMMEKYKCKVYGFDPTPKSVKYVETINLEDTFSFYKYAVSDENGTLTFNLPENEEYVSGSLEGISSSKNIEVVCKNIKTICDELQVDKIDVLKMDIEGTEYKVIKNMMESKIFPKQILIEYHHFFDTLTIDDTKNSISLLLSNDYELFHIEAYNYCFIRE